MGRNYIKMYTKAPKYFDLKFPFLLFGFIFFLFDSVYVLFPYT